MGPQGEGGVEEHSALSAHVLLVRAGAVSTRGAVHGGGVSPALGLAIPPQPDVAILAPAGAPAVPDNVVITIRVGAVAHKLDGVVESNVGGVLAAIIDTAVVSSPAAKIPR